MAIGINDLDFDNPFDEVEQETGTDQPKEGDEKSWMQGAEYQDPEPQTLENEPQPDEGNTEDDLITELLHRQGISDTSHINYQDDQGNISQVAWNDLPREDQLNILSTNTDENNNDLDDEEVELINQIRLGGVSPKEFVDSVKQQAVQEFQEQFEQNQGNVYKVDDISDDELFVLDLKARVDDITDEEVTEALTLAKQNPDLYNKQISGIRKEYKTLEDQKAQQQEAEQEAEYQEQYHQYANSIVNSINSMNDVNGLGIELEDADRQDLATFILGRDKAGKNFLGKALEDPDTLVRVAWFALKGRQALDDVTQYYNQEITKARQAGYQAGLKAQQQQSNPQRKVVVQKPTTKQQFSQQKVYKTINDLD